MNKSGNKPWFYVLVLLVVLSVLFVKSGLYGVSEYNQLDNVLHKIKDANERINYDVLKLRTGVLRHYNSLDEGVSNLYSLSKQLEAVNQVHAIKIVKQLNAELKEKISEKEISINRLKTNNGVLRNSLMYFSVLSEEILTDYKNAPVKNEKYKRFVLVDLPLLNSRVIRVVRNPGRQVIDEARFYIENKIKNIKQYQQNQQGKITLLLNHASVIVRLTDNVNSSVDNILKAGIATQIERIENVLADKISQLESEQFSFRVMLFLISLSLAVYLGYVVLRLQQNRQDLKKNLLDLRYQKLATDKHAVICVVDENEIIREVNENYLQVYGYDKKDVVGKYYQQIHLLNNEDDTDVFSACLNGDIWHGVVTDKTKLGKELWLEMTSVPFLNDNNIYKKIYIGTDITDRKFAEKQIEYQVYHDSLTGLPNRRLLLDRLEQALIICKQAGHVGVLIHLNIDRFKRINESLGHSAGDFLLIEIASRLTKVTENVTVSRLGADEFVILLPDVGEDLDQGNFVAQRLVSKMQLALNEPLKWKGSIIHAIPSFGVTLFPIEVNDPQEILKQAGTALSRAKETGKGQYRFFHPRMQETVENRLHLENDLRTSFENNELFLNIQPQFHSSGKMIGAETLIRWKHEERGLVSPALFIPLAEETGQIIAIGRWVIEQVCKMLAHWQQQYGSHIPIQNIAVNVSPIQFLQDDFVETVEEVINKTGVNPENIELEITEGMLISDIEATIEKITRLKGIGIRFSVDDFGTGYSSLMYLSKLPIEQLKIDQGFVRNIITDKYNAAIVETIISMARHLNMEVIAEGVEQEAELSRLKEMGCYNFQGYYYSKPLSVDDFNNLLAGIHASGVNYRDDAS